MFAVSWLLLRNCRIHFNIRCNTKERLNQLLGCSKICLSTQNFYQQTRNIADTSENLDTVSVSLENDIAVDEGTETNVEIGLDYRKISAQSSVRSNLIRDRIGSTNQCTSVVEPEVSNTNEKVQSLAFEPKFVDNLFNAAKLHENLSKTYWKCDEEHAYMSCCNNIYFHTYLAYILNCYCFHDSIRTITLQIIYKLIDGRRNVNETTSDSFFRLGILKTIIQWLIINRADHHSAALALQVVYRMAFGHEEIVDMMVRFGICEILIKDHQETLQHPAMSLSVMKTITNMFYASNSMIDKFFDLNGHAILVNCLRLYSAAILNKSLSSTEHALHGKVIKSCLSSILYLSGSNLSYSVVHKFCTEMIKSKACTDLLKLYINGGVTEYTEFSASCLSNVLNHLNGIGEDDARELCQLLLEAIKKIQDDSIGSPMLEEVKIEFERTMSQIVSVVAKLSRHQKYRDYFSELGGVSVLKSLDQTEPVSRLIGVLKR